MNIQQLQDLVASWYTHVSQDENHPPHAIHLAAKLNRYTNSLVPSQQPIDETVFSQVKARLIEFWDWALRHAVRRDWRTNGIIDHWLYLQEKLANNQWLAGAIYYPFFKVCLTNEFNSQVNQSMSLDELLPLLHSCCEAQAKDKKFWQAIETIPTQELTRLFNLLHGRLDKVLYELLIALIRVEPGFSDAQKYYQQTMLTSFYQQSAMWLIFFQVGHDERWVQSVITALKIDVAIEQIIDLDDLLTLTKQITPAATQQNLVEELYDFCLNQYDGWINKPHATNSSTFFKNKITKQQHCENLREIFEAFDLSLPSEHTAMI